MTGKVEKKGKIAITVIILARNAAKTIANTLDSVAWADEILLIDDYSEDQTVALARRWGSTVYHHHLNGDFARQRNWALKRAAHDWVFFVDADEIVPPCLRDEIVRRLEKKERGVIAYQLRRDDFFLGQKLNHGENNANWFLRLGKKNLGAWRGYVHEEWLFPRKSGQVKKLHCRLHHQLPSLTGFLEKINFYTSLRAKELYHLRRKSNAAIIVAYPLAKFFKLYLWQGGWRDGTAGIVMALLMALHSFLVRAKLWYFYHER